VDLPRAACPSRSTARRQGGTAHPRRRAASVLEHEQEFADRDPVVPFWLTWKPLPGHRGGGESTSRSRMPAVRTRASSLFPWSVYIPHEEVNFATGFGQHRPAETPKLQASLNQIADALAKHKNLGPIKLYIAGHTDTVGAAPYNLGLSRKRAQSIAGWFRKNGLRIPIAYEGFGEFALAVATPDNTDEPRNRRVDYILSVEESDAQGNGVPAGLEAHQIGRPNIIPVSPTLRPSPLPSAFSAAGSRRVNHLTPFGCGREIVTVTPAAVRARSAIRPNKSIP